MQHEGLYSGWPRPDGLNGGWPRGQTTGEDIAYYRITLGTWISPAWSPWFEEMHIQNLVDGTACVEGSLTDQAALFGLLWQIRDLNLPLLSVERAEMTLT